MIKMTKWLIWAYLILLLFEGALRKWWLTSLSDPLLVIRDPVALAIYMGALATGRFPRTPFIIFILLLTFASVLFSFLGGQTNLFVLLYGIRTNYLHFPLVWVIAELFDREDVERMGSFILLYGIVATLLMIEQFRSPPNAKVNWGVGGEGGGGQIHGAGGRIRPPGFFSFAIGTTVFIPILTAFVLHQASSKRRLWFPLLIAAGVALAVALPISISRGTMIGAMLVGVVFALALLRLGLINMALVRTSLIALAVLVGLSFIPVFEQARFAFMDRWTIAAEESGGQGWGSLFVRVASVVGVPLYYMSEAPFFGHGVGFGSPFAAKLLTGQRGFMLAEDEWSKSYLELGPVLGTAFLGFRILVGIMLLRVALRALSQRRDLLPILIWSASIPTSLVFYQWAQPTVLGCAVLGGGLLLASTNYRDEEEDDEEDEDEDGETDESETVETSSPTEYEEKRRRMRGL